MDPMTFAIAAVGTSSVASAGLAVASGSAAAGEADIQATAEHEAAKSRMDARLQRVVELRGAQRAAAGAAGISFDSESVAAVERDRTAAYRAEAYNDRFGTNLILSRLRARGANAKRQGWAEAGLSLLNAGGQIGYMKGLSKLPKAGTR